MTVSRSKIRTGYGLAIKKPVKRYLFIAIFKCTWESFFGNLKRTSWWVLKKAWACKFMLQLFRLKHFLSWELYDNEIIQIYAWDWHIHKEIPHKNFWVSWGVLFEGLGVQKDTQTPCWLRPCVPPLQAAVVHQYNADKPIWGYEDYRVVLFIRSKLQKWSHKTQLTFKCWLEIPLQDHLKLNLFERWDTSVHFVDLVNFV